MCNIEINIASPAFSVGVFLTSVETTLQTANERLLPVIISYQANRFHALHCLP